MARLEFNHIAWAKTEPLRHRFDLADSAVATPDLAALGLPDAVPLPRGGYPEVLPALERALAERITAPAARVRVTAGASEANACVFAALLGPGDEALVERPGYEPHRALAGLFGATLRTFERPRARDFAGFVPAIEAALSPATRLVVVSHLHNPSGVPLDPADVEALDQLAERRGFHVLADETYLDAAGGPRPTLAARGPRWITTASLTKSYGLGGLRIGWIAAGSAAVFERCGAAQNGLSANPSLPAVALALALAPHYDRLLARALGLLAVNRARWRALVERLGGAGGLDAGVVSQGITTWCLFPDERGGDAFAAFASRHHDLAVTPGRFLGDPRGARISLGSEPERCGAALAELERALAAFAAARAGSGAPA